MYQPRYLKRNKTHFHHQQRENYYLKRNLGTEKEGPLSLFVLVHISTMLLTCTLASIDHH